MQPGGIRPQPPLTRETAPTAFALRNIADRKSRGRLRAAATVEAIGKGELEWVDADGWRYQLEAPPRVTISPKDIERAAATVDLRVWDASNTLIFRDRIHAWDGFPVLVPDGTEHEEDDGRGGKVRVSNFREAPLEAARIDLAHTVRVVTKDGKTPWVKAKPGTVSTFYANTEDGRIESFTNGSYDSARAGTGLAASSTETSYWVGQTYSGGFYSIKEAFLSFNTSAIGDSDTINAASLSVYGATDSSTTDFTIQARTKDWGASLTTADWVAGADLGALTLLATFSTSGFTTSGYNTFTENGSNLRSAISLTGITYILLNSSRHEAGNTPTGSEQVKIYFADEAGTTQDPKLVVTYTPPAIVVTPGTASLTTAPFAPTTRLDKIATPGVASLSLSAFAPAIINPQSATPGTLAAVLAVFAPTVLTPLIVTPGSLALTTDTFAPDLTSDITAIPGTLAAALTTFAPTVFTPRSVTPDTLSAVLAAFAPTAVVGEIARPDAASLALVAFAATALTPRLVTPDTLAAALTGFAPIASTSRILTPDKASLLLAAFAPLILTPVVAAPGIGELVTARFAPTTRLDMFAVPGTLATVLTAFAPDAAYTTDVYLTPGPGSLVIAMFAPDLVIPIWLPGPQRGVGRYAAIPVSSLGRVPFVMRGAGRSDRPQRGGGR